MASPGAGGFAGEGERGAYLSGQLLKSHARGPEETVSPSGGSAAERFQMPLSTLNQKIKRLGIETRRRSGGRGDDSGATSAGK